MVVVVVGLSPLFGRYSKTFWVVTVRGDDEGWEWGDGLGGRCVGWAWGVQGHLPTLHTQTDFSYYALTSALNIPLSLSTSTKSDID